MKLSAVLFVLLAVIVGSCGLFRPSSAERPGDDSRAGTGLLDPEQTTSASGPKIETGFAEVNGTRLCYEVAGTGDPIVLIHGNFGDRRYYDGQFEALARLHRVLRYDIRGYGKSMLPEEGGETQKLSLVRNRTWSRVAAACAECVQELAYRRWELEWPVHDRAPPDPAHGCPRGRADPPGPRTESSSWKSARSEDPP